jgi:hypothetical protein
MFCEYFFPFPPSPDNEKGSLGFHFIIIIIIIIFGEICLDCLSLPPLPCLVMKKPIPCFVRIQLDLFSLPLTLP